MRSSDFDRWQYGKSYMMCQDGDLIIGRERHVNLGDMRVFRFNDTMINDKLITYYAERTFSSIIPFRAPVIWWRKFKVEE